MKSRDTFNKQVEKWTSNIEQTEGTRKEHLCPLLTFIYQKILTENLFFVTVESLDHTGNP